MDLRARELLRAWRESNADTDLGPWLRHQIRHGILTERLVLASAVVGVYGARLALDNDTLVANPLLTRPWGSVWDRERMCRWVELAGTDHWDATLELVVDQWGEWLSVPSPQTDAERLLAAPLDQTRTALANNDPDAGDRVLSTIVLICDGPFPDTIPTLPWGVALEGVRTKLVPVLLGLE